MLKNEEVEAEIIPAGTARVTPEELAAAITRIEARKEAQQRHQAGTVAIGEVVQQLGLDATPEEVLAEVESERARLKPPPKKRLSARQRLSLWLATGTTVVGLGLAALWATPSHIVSPGTSSSTASSVSDTSSQPQHLQLDPNLPVTDASGKMVLLSEVGDNQPVMCSLNVDRLQQNSVSSTSWTLVKHDGKAYVCGWMKPMSPKVLQGDGADVCAFRYLAGDFVVPVTLPVNGFRFSDLPGPLHNSVFHAEGIHLDKHAWEKW